MRQEEGRGVGDFGQTAATHLEDAYLGGGAETVFQGSEDAEAVIAVALELEDGIDDMLHDLGTGKGAVLGDMADEQHGDARGLGIVLELGGALTDLAHAACWRVDILGDDGLDGVDNEKVGLHRIDMLEDALGDGIANHVAVVGMDADAVGAHAYLLLALLAADIKQTAVADGQCSLQQQGALAYARFAAQQQEATRHYAAAEYAVELGAMGWDALGLAVGDLLNAFRDGLPKVSRLGGFGGGGLHHLFDKGVPLAALGAAPYPRRRLVATLLAEII